ncbi:hypothetical protein [Pectobacterium polaris]|uniref:Leucine-rich repeat domain-containing protein n=1 Tax=Pectobacterium polaris TaxID=2042057 RepID=A0AAW5GA13_9GAMM|nr:hypothetical protein [Pectobacterium polaris]MCL6350401.1 hypothetical protein [Pectobacterium polaris]MCL6367675.1 hypothetical protein [Pectobacterium polaris]
MSEINNLTILNQLDRLRLKENPYSMHSLSEEDEITRRHYCSLLFMVLLSHGPICANQQRMLQLWLPTIGMEGRQAELCQLAMKLEQDGLEEVINALRDVGGNDSFMLDCLIFTRVKEPLTQQQIVLLENLAFFLDIDQPQMETIVYAACLVLGLPVGEKKASELTLGIHCMSVWREFLDDYIELLFLGLREWAENNDLESKIPWDKNRLGNTSELNIYSYGYSYDWEYITPFPAGLSLLENLETLNFNSYKITIFPHASILPKNIREINIGDYGGVNTIPSSISQLKKLKKLQIQSSYLKNIPEKVLLFLQKNNIEHNINDSCFIKGPKR